jgi:hypothetical protein
MEVEIGVRRRTSYETSKGIVHVIRQSQWDTWLFGRDRLHCPWIHIARLLITKAKHKRTGLIQVQVALGFRLTIVSVPTLIQFLMQLKAASSSSSVSSYPFLCIFECHGVQWWFACSKKASRCCAVNVSLSVRI